ncbi:MAG: mip [Gammaproteobacteria bacterium]|jgi:FKBP-type peptidyl-prolyl cis-trans isomerase FklB|nr:mip [Gammaproteobacteria bacterium]
MKRTQLALVLVGMVSGMAYAAPASSSAQNETNPATNNVQSMPVTTATVPAGMQSVTITAPTAPAANPQPAATVSTTTMPAAKKAQSATPGTTMSDNDKISYTLGADMGRNLKEQSLTMNPQLFARGITDGLAGGPFLLTDAQMKQSIDDFKKVLYAKQAQNRQQAEAQQKAAADKNAKEGAAFLAANKTKQGVQTMPDGLQYRSLTTGTGAMPTSNDTVTVDYEGRLIDGTVFDSSYKQGQPVSFKVAEVIPGWQEALTHMKVGDVWEIYVPSQLAYGAQGVGGPIGPNQTLIFKIHLIDVKPANTAMSQKAATVKKA